MLYPDGGVVDLFVLERGVGYTITDFGEALAWLSLQSVSLQYSPRQQALINDVCETLRIEYVDGQLVLRQVVKDELADSVLRVAQAALRVSDVWFTLRNQAVHATADEVGEWLLGKQIRFERRSSRQGRSTRNWTVDFEIWADRRTSLVFLLNTGARGAARRIAEHVLAGCVDLSHLKVSEPGLAFVSLFDDTQDVWRPEDFRLLEEHSRVARWSHPDEFERILTAP